MVRRFLLLFPVFLFSASVVNAQPRIYYRGVVNVASSMAPGLPNGGIARGSQFAVYGRNLGPDSSPPLAFPLQNTLGGVTITVTQGQTVLNAIPVFVSPGQINAIMPSTAPLGMVSLQIRVNNFVSNPAPVRVVNSGFGIFTAQQTGMGPAIAQNIVTSDNRPIDTLQAPATHGQTITLWGTGLGPVPYADNIAPTQTTLPIQTEVFVGGKSASVAYSGRSSCCAGIDQIFFTIPSDAPSGCWVPVYVRTAGSVVSNFTTMAISDSGPCAESSNALPAALLAGGKIASAVVSRVSVRQDVGVQKPGDVTSDLAGVYAAEESSGPFNFNPMFSLPPAGTCTAYAVAGDFPAEVSIAGVAPTKAALDPGNLSAQGAKSNQPFSGNGLAGQFLSFLGGAISALPILGNTLQGDAGPVQIAGAGGKNIGVFQISASLPQPLTWTNRDQINTIDRTQPLVLNWTGGDPKNAVLVAGGAVDLPNNATALFLCLAPPGVTSFTVPAAALANIPAAGSHLVRYLGAVYLVQWNLNAPTKFSASGIDTGIATAAGVLGKSVSFK